jgi:hypothetical protein
LTRLAQDGIIRVERNGKDGEYDVADPNPIRWSERGYIRVVDQDRLRVELDEAGVAYVSALFKRAAELTESPIRAGWVLKKLLE